MNLPENRKIAIVYDWIDKWGGVERVLLTLHEMYPEAEFFTSYYDPENAKWAKGLIIKTSFIQNLPQFIKGNRLVSLPFYPYAFESFDFSDYDLVISISSSFAKSIITKPGTRHICYLLTPTRFLWSHTDAYFKNRILRSVASPFMKKLREWDYVAAQRPDKIISISQTVADRAKKYYKRESEVIYPPFDVKYWGQIKKNVILGRSEATTPESLLDSGRAPSSLARMTIKKKKYFLVVSRLEPYKKIDLVIKVFNLLNGIPYVRRSHNNGMANSTYKLVVVGEGSEKEKLKQMAGNNITFLANLTDNELGYLYSDAEALIMPQEEDFGYVSLEAQFFGCPVIAYDKGGASETMIDGKTGIFFREQTEKALKEAIVRFDMVKYDLMGSVKRFGPMNVERFSKEKFIKSFSKLLNLSHTKSSLT